MKIFLLLEIFLLVLELSEAKDTSYCLTVTMKSCGRSGMRCDPPVFSNKCYNFVMKVCEGDDGSTKDNITPNASFECTKINSNPTPPTMPISCTGSTTDTGRSTSTSSNTIQQGLVTTVGRPTSNPTPTYPMPCSGSAINPYTTPAALGAIVGAFAVLLIIVLVGWMLTCCLAFKIRGVRDKNKTDIR